MGAKLSLLDIITDIYMIYQYLSSEEEGQAIFGFINLAMVAVSLLIQLIIVYLQNKKKGIKELASEALTVFLFLKPAVDAMKVASGAEMEEGSAMDPITELAATKGVEMVSSLVFVVWWDFFGGGNNHALFTTASTFQRSSTLPFYPLLPHIKVHREHTCRYSPILRFLEIREEKQGRPVVNHNFSLYNRSR